jgi:hypothetical protein
VLQKDIPHLTITPALQYSITPKLIENEIHLLDSPSFRL